MLPQLLSEADRSADGAELNRQHQASFDVKVRGRWRVGVIVQLRGELDVASAELLTAVLDSCLGRRAVYLDLAGLTFLDCAGLGAILAAAEQQRRCGGRLALLQPSVRIRKLLQLTRADRVVSILDF